MANQVKLEGIMKNGYGFIPKMVMKDKEMDIEAKGIYAYLSSYAGAGRTAFPSVSLICDDLNISENRFYKYRKQLLDKGYVKIEKNRKDGKMDNNIYVLPLYLQNEGIENEGMENEGTNKNNLNNNINKIYTHWIDLLSDVNNAQLTEKQKEAISIKLKKWSVDDIKQAISNYNEVYRSTYYYSHNFTLYKFIKQSNGIPRFVVGLDDKYDGDIWKDYKKSNCQLPEGISDDEVEEFLANC